jgi:hypothetical protein
MKPSGLNSIEYVLHFLGSLWKIAGYVILIIVVGPVLYFLWSWHTMSFQAKTIIALNNAPVTRVVLDFNQCQIVATKTSRQIGHAVKVEVDGVKPQVTLPWLWHWLPWAPGMPPDHTENNPTTSYGNYEGVYLNHYRRPKDIPHADPWYLHGLLKLAPTKHWDDRTGPDYAFGKVAGNYLAYVGAVRSVAAMRYLLGGIAAGQSQEHLVSFASMADGLHLLSPNAAYKVSGCNNTQAKLFLTGYVTDFNGRLPVVTLDLQKFDEATWDHQDDLRAMSKHSAEWDKRMGWWGGTGAGQGGTADNSRDFFITGLHLPGEMDCRPSFTPLDFLFNHLPSITANQQKAQAELARMTEDAYWDPLVPSDEFTRDAAHVLLRQVRKDLEIDYRFSRKYGYILFQGDKFGRSPTTMNE